MKAPPGRRARAVLAVLFLLAGPVPASAAEGQAEEGARELLERAVAAACEADPADPGNIAGGLRGLHMLEQTPVTARGTVIGWRSRFARPSGEQVIVERIAPGGRLRQVSAELHVTVAGSLQPRTLILAGPGCVVRGGRRLDYEASGIPLAVEVLDAELAPTGVSEPLNPPVPAGADPGGVAVATVDAGVNYLLWPMSVRLARDAEGAILGYDYWEMDRRPFDAHPARSPFFPQRHGTRTASLLLEEAPVARLVPYRYPRPDMSRMHALVNAAAEAGVRVVNLSLGSDDAQEWRAFERAARAHPDLLFVASAGNNGRDIDDAPVYPAALALDNLLTVTSATDEGALAPGSNWGRRSVDLMVPGEDMLVTRFDGTRGFASGSSYAAVRISALAACLLAAHPDWRAREVREAILARAEATEAARRRVAHGFVPAPTAHARGECPPAARVMEEVSKHLLSIEVVADPETPAPAFTHALRPTFVVVEGSGWTLDEVRSAARGAAGILARCGVLMPEVSVRFVAGPERLRYYHLATATELVQGLGYPKPAVHFVKDTRRPTGFDAETFARSNSRRNPALADTIWVTRRLPHPAIGLAHEIVHVLADSGEHSTAPGNLMQPVTAPEHTRLSPAQCERMRRVGTDHGLLEPL